MGKFNWRSIGAAIFATLTMLAALPYSLGAVGGIDVATIIPPAWKAKIVIVGLCATAGLRIWNSIVPKQTEPKTGI